MRGKARLGMGMKATKGKDRFNAAKFVFDKIVEGLKKGDAIWLKPWVDGAFLPCNAVTKRSYHGFNAFFLNWLAAEEKYSTARFLTFNQCKALGGHVRKGEHSTVIVWADRVHPFKRNANGEIEKDENGKPKHDTKRVIFVDRYFNVFNIDQCEGLPERLYKVEKFKNDPIEAAEAIVGGYRGAPNIEHGGEVACYVPSQDEIRIPKIECFKSSAEYYSTLFHEMIHSTGVPNRCARENFEKHHGEHYAFEELVAEIGAAILCNECGISTTVKNSAAYCKAWLKRIGDGEIGDKQMLSAFNKAWKAAQFVLGRNAKDEGGDAKDGAKDMKGEKGGNTFASAA